jgi:hypothetical protein
MGHRTNGWGGIPMQISSWYLTNGTWRLGPLTMEQAMAALQRPDAGAAVYAWRDGFEAWQPVGAVPELASLYRPQPPTLPARPDQPAQPQPPIPPGWPGADRNQPGHPGYAPAPAAAADVETPWYVVGRAKLLIMSVATVGLYQLYWFYKQWQCVRDRHDEPDVRPVLRTIFAVFFCFGLFERISDRAAERGVEHVPSPGPCTVAYLGLSFTSLLPDPVWMISIASVLPLLSVQRAASALALADAPHADPNTRLTGLNWVAVVIGSLVLLLTIIGLLIGDPA